MSPLRPFPCLPLVLISLSPAKPAHHTPAGHFVNPWSSFVDNPMTFGTALNVYRDWKSKPVSLAEQGRADGALDRHVQKD